LTGHCSCLQCAAALKTIIQRKIKISIIDGDHQCDVSPRSFQTEISPLESVIGVSTGRFKVRVDQNNRQGHNHCRQIVPAFFQLDEFGNAHEIGNSRMPAAMEEKALLAKADCPQ
jgi:ferredoxin